jgi:anti-sigma B factor antagonist
VVLGFPFDQVGGHLGGEGEPVVETDFSVEERQHGDAVLLAVSGELDLRTSPELEERLNGAFGAGAELVILDLRMIEFMDSTGLRVLLASHQRAKENGKRFALVRGADQVERVLTLTGVRDLLTIVDGPDELLTAGDAPVE